MRPNRRALRRFFSYIEVSQSGCWDWCGCRNNRGYGVFGVATGHTMPAHRVSYTWFVKAIGSGLVIDHLCRNRSCVNPSHLEAVTISANVLRGLADKKLRESRTVPVRLGQ